MSNATSARIIRYVPNALSSLRLLLALVFPWIDPSWRLPVILIAGATDGLDGLIARRFHAKSAAGGLLDAIADKAFVVSVLLTMIVQTNIAWWQALCVIVRDLAIAVVVGYTATQGEWGRFREMRSRLGGKATTACLFAWFVALTTSWDWLAQWRWPLFILTAAMSAFAAADYLAQFARAQRQRSRQLNATESRTADER